MKRIMRPLALSFGVSCVLAAAPGLASAQEANGFGEKGELIVTADRLLPLLSYSSETVTFNQNGQDTTISNSGTSIALLLGREPSQVVNPHTIPRLALDYTVIHHLTVGGSLVLGFGLGGSTKTESGPNSRTNDTPKVTVVGFVPRVGYVLPLTHTFGFWPRAGIAFYSISSKEDNIANNGTITSTIATSNTVWSLDLDPQFVWVPLQHFFAHFGPILNVPFTGSRSVETVTGGNSNTNKNDLSIFHFGLSAGLGGWFDL